ncbi:helix-turn-helix domain-containing protein [Cellulosilyticum sp. I15G10I2]|uniref:helix-turn-helix domain-containing protein n=1 Tax=Cellulosilyticum sp. I15G10I2 TaxID=1892843 RepID=UPI00085C4882
MINNKELGKLIQNLRISSNISSSELGTRIGKSKSSIKKYECGQTSIPLCVLQSICTVLGYDLELIIRSGFKKHIIK